MMLRRERVTKLLYSKHYIIPAMQYGIDNEPVAREAYIAKQHEHNRTIFVSKNGLHIGCLVSCYYAIINHVTCVFH